MTYNYSFDPFGNLYILNTSNNDIYQVYISGQNVPYLVKGNYNIINKYTNTKNLTLQDKQNALRTKIQKKLEKQRDEEAFDSDDEYYLDNEDDSKIDYYPEDNDYYSDSEEEDDEEENSTNKHKQLQLIDEENINSYGERNLEFNFMQNDPTIEINYRIDGEIMALYDTFIYKQNKLVFNSHSKDNSSIYRIRIIDNIIHFRLIGYNEEKYNIEIVDGEISLKCISNLKKIYN